MSARSVGRARAEIELSQGSRVAIPPSLLRFQVAIGGHGYVSSPRRGYLYYWRAGRRTQVEAVVQSLWPWLDEVKRAQVRTTVHRDNTLAALLPVIDADAERPIARGFDTHELAWAAGFFSGDGTFGAYKSRRMGGSYRRLAASLPQASADDVPSCLLRFRAAVLDIGRIAGPRTREEGWGRLPQYRWETWGFAETQAVIALLWSYLTEEKRTQALSALVAARDARRSPRRRGKHSGGAPT